MEKKKVISLVVLLAVILVGVMVIPKLTTQTIKTPKVEETIDDTDIYFKMEGEWSYKAYNDEFHGTGYREHKPGTGEASAIWKPWKMPDEYEVYAWWPQGQRGKNLTECSENALFVISHKDGETEVTVNQQIDGGQWNYLGTFTDIEKIELKHSEDGIIMADAIKLVSTYYQNK